jgi:hypothetical protein
MSTEVGPTTPSPASPPAAVPVYGVARPGAEEKVDHVVV